MELPSYSSHWWLPQHAAPCQRRPSGRFDLRWRETREKKERGCVLTRPLVFFRSHMGAQTHIQAIKGDTWGLRGHKAHSQNTSRSLQSLSQNQTTAGKTWPHIRVCGCFQCLLRVGIIRCSITCITIETQTQVTEQQVKLRHFDSKHIRIYWLLVCNWFHKLTTKSVKSAEALCFSQSFCLPSLLKYVAKFKQSHLLSQIRLYQCACCKPWSRPATSSKNRQHMPITVISLSSQLHTMHWKGK